jgi:hypothetical protein
MALTGTATARLITGKEGNMRRLKRLAVPIGSLVALIAFAIAATASWRL